MLRLSRGQRPAEAKSSEMAKCGEGGAAFLDPFPAIVLSCKRREEAWRLAQNMVK